MKCAAARAAFSGPFALGTFSAPGRAAVPRPRRAGGPRARPAHRPRRAGPDHPRAAGALGRGAAPPARPRGRTTAGDWQPLDGLRVHAPVEPRQIFQSGANYRQHVIDLEVAHRSPDDPRTERGGAGGDRRDMDRRAAEDLPYVFIGLPTRDHRPVRRRGTARLGREAGLGAGAGGGDRPRPRYRVDRRRGAGVRRRRTPSPTTSPTGPPCSAGTCPPSAPTGCAQERPRFHAARPVARAAPSRRRPGATCGSR